MPSALPPILKLSESLMVDLHQAVSRFAKRHKYRVGEELCSAAFEVALQAKLAWRDRDRGPQSLDGLVVAIEGLKLRMQLASAVKAFASFKQFEAFAGVVEELGRQTGGWRRTLAKKHPKGQSRGASP